MVDYVRIEVVTVGYGSTGKKSSVVKGVKKAMPKIRQSKKVTRKVPRGAK